MQEVACKNCIAFLGENCQLLPASTEKVWYTLSHRAHSLFPGLTDYFSLILFGKGFPPLRLPVTPTEEIQALLKPYSTDPEKRDIYIDCIRYLAWRFFQHVRPIVAHSSVSDEDMRTFCLEQCKIDLDRLSEVIEQDLQDQLQRCIDQIENISTESPGADDDISRFYGHLFALLAKARPKSGFFETPASVARFMVDILELGKKEAIHDNKKKVIYDPAAGIGSLLIEAEKEDDITLIGNEIDPVVAMLGTMNMALHGIDIARFSCKNALSAEVLFPKKPEKYTTPSLFPVDEPERADAILAHLPFHAHELASQATQKLPSDFKSQYDRYYLQQCMNDLKKDGKGRCAVVVERSVLERKTKGHLKLRKELFHDFTIQMIVTLPSKTFGEASTEETFLLCFSSGQQRLTQETLRYILQGPVTEKSFAPVLAIWSQWSDYLAGKVPKRPGFEQNEHLWIESYEDLYSKMNQSGYTEQAQEYYCLIRKHPGECPAPISPILLTEQLLEQTECLREATLKLRELLKQREKQA